MTYNPTIANVISVTHFNIICEGGNTLNIECLGISMQYDVYLSTTSINFGEIKIDSTTSRLLTINNESDMPTTFEFFN